MKIGEVIPLLLLYAFMGWTETTLPLMTTTDSYLRNMYETVERHQIQRYQEANHSTVTQFFHRSNTVHHI
jgi:hypothetical protein